MATLTGELISETYDSLLKVTDNNTITGIKKRITDGFGNDIPLLLSSTDIQIDGTLILSALTDLAPATKFLSLKADNSVGFRTSSELLSDIGGASSSSISGTTGRLSKFTSSGVVGNSILNEIGNVIHLTDGTSSYASFGINNPGIDNDAYIGSTINNDFTIRVNNTEAARFDTALRFKIANIQNATTDTDKFLVSDGGVVKYRTGAEVLTDIGAVSSVGLTMPVAFSVANSPIESSGTLAVTAVGTASQYIRGDGQLATLPTGAGGGSAVNYYLNGSIASSVATYQQMDNSAVIGAGTDFNLVGNGLVAQFLTNVNNPNRLLIPGGAWNLEMFFSVSSAGGNQKFYVDLLKYNGTTFSLIATTSGNPEEITGGTSTDLYLTSIAVPETVLLTTDRLAIRVYIVDNAVGRTVTLHTEDNNLCQIITTFAGGISALNGLTANTQYFAVGTSGTDFAILSLTDTHTFNLPTASATNRGALSTTDWSTFNNKIAGTIASGQVAFGSATNTVSGSNNLFWDNTNSRLGINTASPTAPIDLGSITGTAGSISKIALYASIYGNYGFGVSPNQLDYISANSHVFYNNSPTSTELFRIDSVGNIKSVSLVGTGTRMVVTNNLGLLSSQAIPTGTVTSVSALTLGTSGTDLNSTVENSNTTPVITLNVPDASATARGVVTIGSQTFAGAKSFSSDITVNSMTMGRGTGGNIYNMAIGQSALLGGGGSYNMAIGYQALQAVNTGSFNIAFGALSLTANTSGSENTAFGANTLRANTSGVGNSAFGRDSLRFNTIGLYNMAIGQGSLYFNTSGNFNVAIGQIALYANTTGIYNSAFGTGAGRYTNSGAVNQTSSYSIYVGNDTRASASGNENEIVIGSAARGGGSNSVTLGNTNILTTNLKGNVGIGYTTNPNLYNLDVNGTANIVGQLRLGSTITNGTYTYTLPSATGVLALTSELSGYVPYTGATGSVNLGAFDLTVNGLTVGLGGGGQSSNTAVGSNALFNNTTGSSNTAFGDTSLQSCINGYGNSAFGRVSLRYLTSGYGNTAMGTNLESLTTGYYNTAVGFQAGSFINSGAGNETSNNSIYLGYYTRASASGNTNEIVIGASALGGGSNSVTLGNSSIATTNLNGNVAIGYTTNPSVYKLDVNGTLRVAGAATFSSSVTSGGRIQALGGGSNGVLTLENNGSITLPTNGLGLNTGFGVGYISNRNNGVNADLYYEASKHLFIGGNVGIGTTSPGYQLQLSTDSAAKPTSALWTIASDLRIKENINPYTKGLTDLLKINPVTYDYNGLGGFKKGKGGVGIIAQEIMNILPDSVNAVKGKLKETDKEEIDILNFNGHELTYVLINAIKELNAKITQLENK